MFKVKEEIVWWKDWNNYKKGKVLNSWIVREIKPSNYGGKSYILDNTNTGKWTAINSVHLVNYLSVDVLKIKFPEEFI